MPSKTDIYRYGVETTTLSEIELRSTAHTTAVITQREVENNMARRTRGCKPNLPIRRINLNQNARTNGERALLLL